MEGVLSQTIMTIILRFENEFYQDGGYFVGIYDKEPESPNGHWGREDYENTWYLKYKIEVNKIYINCSYQEQPNKELL